RATRDNIDRCTAKTPGAAGSTTEHLGQRALSVADLLRSVRYAAVGTAWILALQCGSAGCAGRRPLERRLTWCPSRYTALSSECDQDRPGSWYRSEFRRTANMGRVDYESILTPGFYVEQVPRNPTQSKRLRVAV